MWFDKYPACRGLGGALRTGVSSSDESYLSGEINTIGDFLSGRSIAESVGLFGWTETPRSAFMLSNADFPPPNGSGRPLKQRYG